MFLDNVNIIKYSLDRTEGMDNPETLATLGTGYRTNTNNPPPLFPKKQKKQDKITAQNKNKNNTED